MGRNQFVFIGILVAVLLVGWRLYVQSVDWELGNPPSPPEKEDEIVRTGVKITKLLVNSKDPYSSKLVLPAAKHASIHIEAEMDTTLWRFPTREKKANKSAPDVSALPLPGFEIHFVVRSSIAPGEKTYVRGGGVPTREGDGRVVWKGVCAVPNYTGDYRVRIVLSRGAGTFKERKYTYETVASFDVSAVDGLSP